MATVSTFDKLIQNLEAAQQKSLSENQKRYEQMLAIYDEVIQRYQPGGAFEKAGLAQLETQKTRDIGGATQQMIGSGLYGTTTTAALPQTWEATVGAPARTKLEDIMMQRLSEAQIGKAGVIGDVTDIGPNYSDIINLMMARGQAATPTAQPMYQSAPSAPYQSLESWLQQNFPQPGQTWGGGGGGSAPQTATTQGTTQGGYAQGPGGSGQMVTHVPYSAEAQKKMYADITAGQTAGKLTFDEWSRQQGVRPEEGMGAYSKIGGYSSAVKRWQGYS